MEVLFFIVFIVLFMINIVRSLDGKNKHHNNNGFIESDHNQNDGGFSDGGFGDGGGGGE